jgi:hypothetical protein
MNAKERLTAAIEGQSKDYLPFSPFSPSILIPLTAYLLLNPKILINHQRSS